MSSGHLGGEIICLPVKEACHSLSIEGSLKILLGLGTLGLGTLGVGNLIRWCLEKEQVRWLSLDSGPEEGR